MFGNTNSTTTGSGAQGSGIMGKLSGLAGGGHSGNSGMGTSQQPKMDPLDKGVAFIESKITGKKSTGSAMDRAKTEKISDAVRTGYSKMTGKNVPIKDT